MNGPNGLTHTSTAPSVEAARIHRPSELNSNARMDVLAPCWRARGIKKGEAKKGEEKNTDGAVRLERRERRGERC